MTTITFAMIPERGHLNPTFKLAKALSGRGYKVNYIADKRFGDYIGMQGFERLDLLDPLWRGYLSLKETVLEGTNEIIYDYRADIGEALRKIAPDLLITDALLPMMAHIARQHGIASVMAHTSLDVMMPRFLLDLVAENAGAKQGVNVSLPRLLSVPQLVLCPKELEFNHSVGDGLRLYYTEPSIDLDRKDRPFDWEILEPDKPLIYCSLGTQSYVFTERQKLIEMMIEAMRRKPESQMLIAVPEDLSMDAFEGVPANVKLVNWAPQLEVLKRARLMITHGGLGTVKECILLGVPMVVFPLMRDQPLNAARVVYHGLGVRGDAKSVTSEVVMRLIEQVERDESYRKKVEQMSERFKQMEQEQKGLKIIEKIISILERKGLTSHGSPGAERSALSPSEGV